METVEKDLILLIKSIINSEEMHETELDLSDSSLRNLYQIATKQDLTSIIAAALRKTISNRLTTMKKLKNGICIGVYSSNMKRNRLEVCSIKRAFGLYS